MEIELKFQLSEASRKALESKLRADGGKAKRLIASYFDTPERILSKAGYSLRLRKEGRVWFQTLKSANGPASIVRGEQNVRLGAVPDPQLDLSHHLDTDDGVRVAHLLSKSSDTNLTCRYTTAIHRLSTTVGSRPSIEYALDVGEILAHPDSNLPPLILPVCELEIELVSGPVSGLLHAARKLIHEQDAWIDVRSKAQRGDALARGALIVAPAKARPISVGNASLNALIKDVLIECASQVLQNAAQLSSTEGGTPEHVHQLRIGLRRLRSAIKLFAPFIGDHIAAWESPAKLIASGLGGNRDVDMMAESIWPQLRKIGAPLVELPLHDDLLSPDELIREKTVQQWLLELLAFELQGSGEIAEGEWTKVLPLIQDWYDRCKKGALRFDKLDAGRRHRLRKRFKRLRYAVEFIASELPSKRYARFNNALVSALDTLGQYNDLQIAERSYRDVVETDSRAWFALGWLQAQITKAEGRCAKALVSFCGTEPPWGQSD